MSKLYTNPQGLFPFQARLSAYCYIRPGSLVVADQGLGKSHIAAATMAMLLEDGKIDVVVLICEGNKLDEWRNDLAQFTAMSMCRYYGAKRKIDPNAQILMSSYTTWTKDLVEVEWRDNRMLYPTELLNFIKGKRVLVVYDEMALLGTSMTSLQFRANDLALTQWREAAEVKVIGLTATPMSTSPECFFNLATLIAPGTLGTYKEFCDTYVIKKNKYDRPSKFKNLDDMERKLSTFMLRKCKTDPDVIDQFPKTVEKAVYLSLTPAHQKAYMSFDAFVNELPESKILPAFRALNAFTCHPRTVLSSEWKAAQDWVTEYGADKIAKLVSAKARSVIGYVTPITRSDSGGVIIFSDSVTALDCLATDIEAHGIDGFHFVKFHGGQTDAQNRMAKDAFKAGDVKVMLASSKAERGINLPEAGYIVHYGVPTLHSSYLQRNGRGSRIGSNVDGTVIVKTFITRGTIERGTVGLWQARNEWSDRLQDPLGHLDDNFVSVLTRRLMLKIAQRQGDDDPEESAA